MLRSDVPTPGLIVDIEILDRNIATMFARARDMGVAVRPHAKAHKCAEIGQRLVQAGAVGASCATIEEAEAMATAGIGGILITSPIVTASALQSVTRLLLRGADMLAVADSSEGVGLLGAAAAAAGKAVGVLIDFDFGMRRTGCVEIADAVALAGLVAAHPSLRYQGLQAYWGNLQQVVPFEERKRLAEAQLDRVRGVIEALAAAGYRPAIVSGAGTGTHAIDAASGLFTEIQPGSFLFMDSCYGSVPTSEHGAPFDPSLFVSAAVVSANRPGRVIVNAGLKAFATDSGKPRPLRGAPSGATYTFMGDEHGAVEFEGAPPPLGATIEFLTSHCDPTVNLYAAFHVARGDEIIDIWPIRARH